MKVRRPNQTPAKPVEAPDTKPVAMQAGASKDACGTAHDPWASFEARQRRAPSVDPAGIGRASFRPARQGPLTVFGTRIPRAGRPLKSPAGPERLLASTLGGLFADGALGSDLHRTAEAVTKAFEAPPVRDGQPLGRTTLLRPGLGNTAPGPAQIARLLKYTDQVVVAHANPGQGEQANLRPVDAIDGVPLPEAARGRVFAIGSPDNVLMDYTQASDVFLEQLERMRAQGLDLSNEGATVVAHSQGGLDTMLTRKRLEQAGHDQVFGRVITLATPFEGSPVSDEKIGGLFTELLGAATRAQSMQAINHLDPDTVAEHFAPGDKHAFVDLAVTGCLDGDAAGIDESRMAFCLTNKVIEAAQWLPARRAKDEAVADNDGLVTLASQHGGKDQLALARSHDHASIAEVPDVIDQIVKALDP